METTWSLFHRHHQEVNKNGQRNTLLRKKRRKTNPHKMQKMRKTRLPREEKEVRSLRLRGITENTQIQLANKRPPQKPPKINNTNQKIYTHQKQAHKMENRGPVDQSGMIAALASRRSRVQIPPGPPFNLMLRCYGVMTFRKLSLEKSSS